MNNIEKEMLKEIEYFTERMRNIALKSKPSKKELTIAQMELLEAKSKLEGYQLAQKETAEKVEKLKEEISFTMNNSDFNEGMIMYDIDKIFKETK